MKENDPVTDENPCGKRQYSSRRLAQQAVHLAKKMRRLEPPRKCRKKIPIRSYLCPVCHTYHLTSHSGNEYS